MNLKRTLLTGIAAVGLLASFAAPPLAAQPAESNAGDNNIDAVVVVNTPGEFNVYFSAASFSLGTVNINAQNPTADPTGSMRIRYTDTLANRPNFDIKMSATNFINSSNSNEEISADEFEITRTENVIQGQCGGPGSQACQNIVDIGDIGFFVDGAYPTGQQAGGNWTPDATDLSGSGTTVHFGYKGIGTITSYGDVAVAVEVPSTTVAGTYTSMVTLTVIAGTRP